MAYRSRCGSPISALPGELPRRPRWRWRDDGAQHEARYARDELASGQREPDARTRVFVYGTLLSGERNHHLLAGARLVGEARTRPRFSLYDLGPFPGLVSHGSHAVTGEIYEVDEPTLAALDRGAWTCCQPR